MIETVCGQLQSAYKSQFDENKQVIIDDMNRYFSVAARTGSDFIGFYAPISLGLLLDKKMKALSRAEKKAKQLNTEPTKDHRKYSDRQRFLPAANHSLSGYSGRLRHAIPYPMRHA